MDLELPALATGRITEILAQEGEAVTVGQVIGRMATGAVTGEPVEKSPTIGERSTSSVEMPRDRASAPRSAWQERHWACRGAYAVIPPSTVMTAPVV